MQRFAKQGIQAFDATADAWPNGAREATTTPLKALGNDRCLLGR
jgi:hypothetical protein